jgi:hypothetical protein
VAVGPRQQALEKSGKWKMEEAERQALGIDFANSLGVQPAEQLKWKKNMEQARRVQTSLDAK